MLALLALRAQLLVVGATAVPVAVTRVRGRSGAAATRDSCQCSVARVMAPRFFICFERKFRLQLASAKAAARLGVK